MGLLQTTYHPSICLAQVSALILAPPLPRLTCIVVWPWNKSFFLDADFVTGDYIQLYADAAGVYVMELCVEWNYFITYGR